MLDLQGILRHNREAARQIIHDETSQPLKNGSFEFIKKAPPFQSTIAKPTTAVLNNKEKWCSRRPILDDLPSPHFFRLKNQDLADNPESSHFSMRMSYSKLFRHKTMTPTPYKPRKMSRWAETIGIIDPPLAHSWRQARIPQVLPKHRSLMLNIANRELWIGERVAKSAKISQECTLCRNGIDSIEHTFINCPIAKKVTNLAHRIISEFLHSATAMGDVDILFGPQSQMPHDSRVLWTITRGHMLWTTWSLRISFRRPNNPPDSPTPQDRIELLAEYSFLSNLLKHIRILRYSDKARIEQWVEYQKVIVNEIRSLISSLPEAANIPVSIQTVITDFFAVPRPSPNL